MTQTRARPTIPLIERLRVRTAARALARGGVVAYPTEGVYGLGCLPGDGAAVQRIIRLKGRSAHAGLILLADDFYLLEPWIDPTPGEFARLIEPRTIPTTWIVTAARRTPDWLSGGRSTLAVRITDHPLAGALSRAANSALVSTSANRSGHPPARSAQAARARFGAALDAVVNGPLGGLRGPSEIRVAADDRVLRAAVKQ